MGCCQSGGEREPDERQPLTASNPTFRGTSKQERLAAQEERRRAADEQRRRERQERQERQKRFGRTAATETPNKPPPSDFLDLLE
eukprot:m.65044 g.65044  ORF g.65044 m.65044 type:complete len:85 (+) comp7551_c0_seq1:1720-1974(+)